MSPSVRREQRNEQRAETNTRRVRPPWGDWQPLSGTEGARQLLSLQVLKSFLSLAGLCGCRRQEINQLKLIKMAPNLTSSIAIAYRED